MGHDHPSLKLIKALILDMDGVLWKSTKAIGNLPDIFNKLDDAKISYTFATNNSTRDEEQYLEKLYFFGITATCDQVVNSSLATLIKLQAVYPNGGGIYIIGESGLHNILKRGGFFHDDKTPQCVVVGMDRMVTYEKMSKAAIFINNGIPFYGTNPDNSFPTPEGQTIGTGAILAAIEAATDHSPILCGKPYPDMMEIALERMDTRKEQTLVVGDRYETDILGGINAGCPTALVLSGVTTQEKLKTFSPQPDFVFDQLSSIVNFMIKNHENNK